MSTAVQRAYESVKQAILEEVYAPGAHLREESIAEKLAVSRTPVREALRILAAEGLVEFVPNYGAYVSNWSTRDLKGLYRVRALLESTAASLAATRMLPVDVRRLATLCDEMEAVARGAKADRLERIAELNREFHRIIVAAADNGHLSSMLAQTIQFPIVHRTFQRYTEDDLARSMHHHRELVAAFEVRDAEWAEAVMKAHVLAATHALVNGGAHRQTPGAELRATTPRARRQSDSKSKESVD